MSDKDTSKKDLDPFSLVTLCFMKDSRDSFMFTHPFIIDTILEGDYWLTLEMFVDCELKILGCARLKEEAPRLGIVYLLSQGNFSRGFNVKGIFNSELEAQKAVRTLKLKAGEYLLTKLEIIGLHKTVKLLKPSYFGKGIRREVVSDVFDTLLLVWGDPVPKLKH